MMKRLSLLAVLAALPLFSGCATVPSTQITLPTPNGAFKLNSPKENNWKNVKASFNPATGEVKFEAESITSANSADVIAAVAAANASMANSVIAGGVKAIELGAAAAVKGASGGIAP